MGKRYFYFAYEMSFNISNQKVDIKGNYFFVCDKFPNRTDVYEKLKKSKETNEYYDYFKNEDFIITNIFEFKNKEDFESFLGDNN